MVYEVNNYQEYMTYLSNYKYTNGNMSDQAIWDFLRRNALTERFGITIYEVRKDLNDMVRSTTVNGMLAMTLQGGVPGKAKGKARYEFLVSEWAKIQHKLTVKHLEDLIQSNHLNSMGLSAADVVADIRELNGTKGKINPSQPVKPVIKKDNVVSPQPTKSIKELASLEEYVNALNLYLSKWKDIAYLDNIIEQFAVEYGLSKLSKNYKDEIRMDLILLNSGNHPSSNITVALPNIKTEIKEDSLYKFQIELTDVVKKYSDRLGKTIIFKGILWDYFPENKKEINVLVHLLEFGISDDIESKKKIDSVFVNRYASRLSNEYGIDSVMAKKITELWCVVYGKEILGVDAVFDT